ncbi:MAG: tRNA pseudouridine(55) synthase TruB [Deltaproteobacteria bacterium]|nr:tRNA pseudouridine(55) synthase TruB [Deltaproteobacteria bacterium]
MPQKNISSMGAGAPFEGILVVDKPAGWTSHDVVAKCRGVIGIRKIGHAGTLDPEATGLLPLCVGRATRIVEYLMDLPKSYAVRMKLGVETDTEDAAGQVIAEHDLAEITESAVRLCLQRYRGEREQVPPMFSALKQGGKRLYQYARAGKVVERKPRKVIFYEIADLVFDLPFLTFRVRCSRGTYVRSLCRDLGRDLGVGGHLTALRRTESAGFVEADAVPLSRLLEMDRRKIPGLLFPIDRPLAGMPRLTVRPDGERRISRGRMLSDEDLQAGEAERIVAGRVRVYGPNDRFLAIGECEFTPAGHLRVIPKKVFCLPS